MNLANRSLHTTDCFLVAFDIVSSSQNLANPNGLARDRRALFEAINQTALVRQCTRSESVVGQFLGDEFRLAFPTTHNGVAIKASAVVEFIDDVLRKLENTTLGYGPVIRAALTNGPIPSMELRKFCYLSGGIVFSQLSNLLGAIDGKKDLLITNLGIQKFQPDRISILPSSILFVSRMQVFLRTRHSWSIFGTTRRSTAMVCKSPQQSRTDWDARSSKRISCLKPLNRAHPSKFANFLPNYTRVPLPSPTILANSKSSRPEPTTHGKTRASRQAQGSVQVRNRPILLPQKRFAENGPAAIGYTRST